MLLILWLLALMAPAINLSSARESSRLRCRHFGNRTRSHTHLTIKGRTLDHEACGQRPHFSKRDRANEARIAGGYEARDGEFPSFVSLVAKLPSGSALCSGTLLTNSLVLTAAHCLEGARGASVAASYKHPMEWSEEDERVTRQVVAVCTSADYHGEFSHDYSVAILEEALEYDDFIQPVCLTDRPTKVGLKAIEAGIGLVSNTDHEERSSRLNALPVRRISDSFCGEDTTTLSCFESHQKPYIGNICKGDSGGPVYAMYGGRQYIVAINVASHLTCQTGKNAQSLHTDVFKIYDKLIGMINECIASYNG